MTTKKELAELMARTVVREADSYPAQTVGMLTNVLLMLGIIADILTKDTEGAVATEAKAGASPAPSATPVLLNEMAFIEAVGNMPASHQLIARSHIIAYLESCK